MCESRYFSASVVAWVRLGRRALVVSHTWGVNVSLEPASDPGEFNRIVAAQPVRSPLQAWGYGEATRVLGHEPMRFYVRDGGRVVGAMQLIRKRSGPGLRRLYAPRGPAVESPEVLAELEGPLRDLARANDAFVKIEPSRPVPAATEVFPGEANLCEDQRLIAGAYGSFRRASTEQPEHTLMADLSPAEESLFAGLHKMARRNVRTAARLGVVVSAEQDFDGFWDVFAATNARAKLGAYERQYYEVLFREANKDGSEAYLVLSRHEGKVLAGGFFLALGDTALYLYGGSVRDERPLQHGSGTRTDVKASDAFYWGALLEAKARGYRTFDFWGIPRVLDESKHSYGVAKMKLKFCTDRYWFPAYDLALSPLAHPLVKALRVRKDLINRRTRGTSDDIL